ncbi:MAG: bifunctional isocitrate dehydrogenase kinase/phosphatase [Chloroflexota bacterium]|nr:bifunctional isocitrate dehydrogenase kinase/phosphatase [Chloroflexota bacterium]
MDSNRVAERAVTAIYHAFDAYHCRFKEITRRAKRRFEQREWRDAQWDASERLALHKDYVDRVLAEVRTLLADCATDVATWAGMKARYTELIAGRDDCELAETFFNSVSRRFFASVGVDPRVQYVSSDSSVPPAGTEPSICDTYDGSLPATELIRCALSTFSWDAPYRDLEGDVERAGRAFDSGLREAWGSGGAEVVDMLRTVFYRNKGAYLVGRLRRGADVLPLVLPLVHTEQGIAVDAVLMTSDEASVVFGFSWSYFHAEVAQPRALVDFLKSIMPLKRIDELYTSIGYNKHGKTELYRSLLRHLEESDTKFEFAEGEAGMVMSVFTLPSFNVVFKIIKDTFGFPKKITRQQVIDKYHFVFERDRVGRLADAQEFEHLEFRRACFSEALLDELLRVAGSTVCVDGDRVIVKHLYTERRVTPLNLYLNQASEDHARDAVLDYGRAIKDLAAANIFTGDMLLKNFGVTRHHRVIFYDYDELVLLTDCNFRRIPQASHMDDEYAPEPWFYVGEQDVFPEEFSVFLVPSGRLRDAFLEAHADLLDVEFWKRMQERQKAGEIVDVFPYKQTRRLRPE